MRIGVSTASLYPLHTENAILELAKLGVNNTELFLNSSLELNRDIFAEIERVKKEYGMNILSFHPFSSPMETLYLFSSYDRRVEEIVDLYKRYFEAMNRLDSKIFIVHGAILSANCSDERYIERFLMLAEVGGTFGVTVAQENVCYCKSGELGFLSALAKEGVKFTLDLKQAVRAGYTAFDALEIIGKNVIHCHVSDSDSEADCLPVGQGRFDFVKFFSELKRYGYGGDMVVELYRANYGEYADLRDCVNKLTSVCEKIM